MKIKPNILDYLDYREYLQDFHDYMKENLEGFSHRYFAKKAGLSSPNHLMRVMSGKFRLGKAHRNKYAEALGLKRNEKEYFYLLVDFNNSKKIEEKNALLAKLNTISKRVNQKELKGGQYKLLSKWYYMVIRNMVNMKGFVCDKKFISKKLKGYISPSEADEALQVLFDLGMIKYQDGRFQLVEKHQVTSDEIKNLAVRNFHSQMIPMGIKSIKTTPIDQREISAATLGVTKNIADKMKGKIKDFYKELVDFAVEEARGADPEEVWQLNMQFFNFTKRGS